MTSRSLAVGLLCLLALAMLAGCASSPPTPSERLLGRWAGTDADYVTQTFEFFGDGTLRWDLLGPNFSGSFDLEYVFADQGPPHPLDLGVFTEGPLSGRSLFGIVEFTSDEQFRLDLEPGPVGLAPGDPAGNEHRPDTFTDDTVIFTRQSDIVGGDDVAARSPRGSDTP